MVPLQMGVSMPPNHPALTSDACYRAFLMIQLLRSTGEHEFPAPLMALFFWIAPLDWSNLAAFAAPLARLSSRRLRLFPCLGPSPRLEQRSGLKLVRRERDPNNYKAWRLYLTPKGRVFRQLLEDNAKKPLDQGDGYKKALKEIQDHDQTDEDLG